ncbi:class I SAM-dependent methyltransferase [Allobranchiibius huperziae]|uniref:Class I SAM-dependent methyltransferase n=1 Tax=Allobranchiibius huperziae TaxID=1874116 RepID=A0A853D908_9MICO|nr:class I SAM-dependent methyltransferase [Allobranchiibius huperziae]NYJ73946.1 hypothetical protein [Allobranchiibius huperziae]
MTTTAIPAGGTSRPHNVQLGPGAMQNWSDLEHHPAGASAAQRAVVQELVRPGQRVAVVGPHSLDVITGIASQVAHLSVITRSIPDAVTIGNALLEHESVDVQCASAATLLEQPEPYDLVVALDDVTRVWSPESEPMTWAQVYDAVRRLVAPGGRLLLGVENELGLQRITSLHSRYTSDHDEDWSVTATFDASRPRSLQALIDVADGDTGSVQVLGALPIWQEQTVLVSGIDELSPELTTLLGALTLGSPAYRRVGADPTRMTRAAVLSGRLPHLCSGWILITGPTPVQAYAGAGILADDPAGRVATYTDVDGQVLRRVPGASDAIVPVSASAESLSGTALDACAAQDVAGLRALLVRYRAWLVANATDGVLSRDVADTRVDNVMLDDDGFQALAPAEDDRPLDEATWAALADLVLVIRARGSRHPWPAATDDTTMLATLGAMVGLPADGVPEGLLAAADETAGLPAHDVSGLLAVVERLTETNEALASRSRWFEERLNVREREMRARAERHRKELELAVKQQRILQDSAEDLRRSITYRAGAAIINPIRKFGGNLRP